MCDISKRNLKYFRLLDKLLRAHLDDKDLAIIKVLMKDGRKSFRQIARETGLTTPTVKARFDRLVNIGFLKSVSPIFDWTNIEDESNSQFIKNKDLPSLTRDKHTPINIGRNIKIKLQCDMCKGPISGEAHVFKFANYERFFCCTQCRSAYKDKYRGRIEALTMRYATGTL